MSLKRAVERLCCDRETERVLRELVALFRRHPGEWVEPGKAATAVGLPPERVEPVLKVLSETFVLDFSDAPPRYRYDGDRLTEIEMDRFLRRMDNSAGSMQANVERFRQRYSR